MAPLYAYSELRDPDRDVRLVTLHPGEFGEEISLSIDPYTLDTTGPDHRRRSPRQLGAKQLEPGLPDGWSVYETVEDEIFFYYEEENGKNWRCQWTHPDPAFDHSSYQRGEINFTAEEGQQHHIGSPRLKYEALSYTWASHLPAEQVEIRNSHNSSWCGALQVGGNLASALRHMRGSSERRILWIDAICINQADMHEREKQVKRMTEIYLGADRVTVWLGEAADNSDAAMQTLDYLGSQLVVSTALWFFPIPNAAEPLWCESTCQLPYDEAMWQAIRKLLFRPWFDRVWIIQEIQLSSDVAVVQCGHQQTSWNRLRRAVTILWNKKTLPNCLPRARLSSIEYLSNTEHKAMSVPHILHLTKGRGCANERDYVYGVLGLFPKDFQALIQPDYASPESKVFKDFVRAHMQHTGLLDLLKDCQLEARNHHDLPSWVPDFSASKAWTKPLRWQRASGSSTAEFELVGDDTLRVLGVRFAVVSLAEATRLARPNDQTCCRVTSLAESLASIAPSRKYELTGEPLPDVFAKTLVCGYLKDRFPEETLSAPPDWTRQVAQPSCSDRILAGISALDNNNTLTFQEDVAAGLLMRRCLLSTVEGYIGVGPGQSQPGDIVVVLLGGDSPMLLRQRPGYESTYAVVGECYVHGLQDGLAILGSLPPQWKVQIFQETLDKSAKFRFLNTDTGELTDDDPRLPQLSSEWEILPRAPDEGEGAGAQQPENDSNSWQRAFRSRISGQVVLSDPRLRPSEISRRGVLLESFTLA